MQVLKALGISAKPSRGNRRRTQQQAGATTTTTSAPLQLELSFEDLAAEVAALTQSAAAANAAVARQQAVLAAAVEQGREMAAAEVADIVLAATRVAAAQATAMAEAAGALGSGNLTAASFTERCVSLCHCATRGAGRCWRQQEQTAWARSCNSFATLRCAVPVAVYVQDHGRRVPGAGGGTGAGCSAAGTAGAAGQQRQP